MPQPLEFPRNRSRLGVCGPRQIAPNVAAEELRRTILIGCTEGRNDLDGGQFVNWVANRACVMQLHVGEKDATDIWPITNVSAGSCAVLGSWQPFSTTM